MSVRWIRFALFAWFFVAPGLVWADGEELYGEYCLGCHGVDAEGLAGYSGSLQEFRSVLDGESAEQMPDFFGVFDAEEVEALFAFIHSSTP